VPSYAAYRAYTQVIRSFEFSIFSYAVSFSLLILVEKCGRYEMFKIVCNVVTFVETRRYFGKFLKNCNHCRLFGLSEMEIYTCVA
jgi:hypothetical protein